ncbi:CIS tube protein [Brasilonema octagenarum]|uniref:CIS tube protein n=1 Tax=Brasilonema octagenarum TaxID=417105 RepID=UPI001B7CF361|nr:hypothetical protein [Brasilonema octagenarum]
MPPQPKNPPKTPPTNQPKNPPKTPPTNQQSKNSPKTPPTNQPNNGAKTQLAEPNQLNPQLAKATLMACNNEAPDIEVMFNPTEISFSRSVNWTSQDGNRGTSLLPKINFSGVQPYQLTLQQLLFDTYETKESVLTKYIDDIKKGVETIQSGDDQRPPVYIFMWGDNKYFPCVIDSLTYTLTMFLTDGTPVRALVDIQLREVDKSDVPPSQGPGDPKGGGPRGGGPRGGGPKGGGPKGGGPKGGGPRGGGPRSKR